jgi:O-antigen ligase
MVGVLRAGRWLLGTYGRFIWLCVICALFLVASGLAAELAYRVSHAALIGLALGILAAAYPFTRRDELKAGSRRAHQMARSRGTEHRQAPHSS